MKRNFVSVLCLILLFAVIVEAQSGGNFTITQSVIAAGGQNSAGGIFSVDGTSGQNFAGENSAGGAFTVRGGFWNSQFAPTAAAVSIGGRILTVNGAGIRRVSITLMKLSSGEIFTVRSSSFGYYRFEEMAVGEIYILTVRSKRFTFTLNTQIITPLAEVTDANFTALPE